MDRPTTFCWNPRLIALSLGAAAVIVAAALIASGFERGSAPRVALAVLQGLATAALVVAIARGVRVLDELQRRIQLEALGFGYAATAIVGTGYGFLEKAGLPPLDWGAALLPAMSLAWMLGVWLAVRRYR